MWDPLGGHFGDSLVGTPFKDLLFCPPWQPSWVTPLGDPHGGPPFGPRSGSYFVCLAWYAPVCMPCPMPQLQCHPVSPTWYAASEMPLVCPNWHAPLRIPHLVRTLGEPLYLCRLVCLLCAPQLVYHLGMPHWGASCRSHLWDPLVYPTLGDQFGDTLGEHFLRTNLGHSLGDTPCDPHGGQLGDSCWGNPFGAPVMKHPWGNSLGDHP